MANPLARLGFSDGRSEQSKANRSMVTRSRAGDDALATAPLAACRPKRRSRCRRKALPGSTAPSATRTPRHPVLGCWLARLFVFGGGLGLTAYGAYEMYKVVEVGGVTLLEWALLFLFVANFSWIALACTSAFAGFIWLLLFPPKPPAPPTSLHERTAIVMPIYNEAPARVFAALRR